MVQSNPFNTRHRHIWTNTTTGLLRQVHRMSAIITLLGLPLHWSPFVYNRPLESDKFSCLSETINCFHELAQWTRTYSARERNTFEHAHSNDSQTNNRLTLVCATATSPSIRHIDKHIFSSAQYQSPRWPSNDVSDESHQCCYSRFSAYL